MSEESINIQRLEEAIFVKKAEGTEVNYFLYPEFEVHRNRLSPGVIQGWHAHQIVEEVLTCTDGTFTVEVIENGSLISIMVEQGDVVRVKKSIHRLVNQSNTAAEFIVFRFVPTGKSQQEKIKLDKREYTKEEIAELLNK